MRVSAIGILIGVFVLLAGLYALATPPMEASDEIWHMGMVDHIADTGQLAVQTPDQPTPYEQQGSQPPLYYLLGAFLVRWIDRSDFEAVVTPNPHAKVGIALDGDNKNLVLHPPDASRWSGTRLAVMLLRAVSILMAAGTVYAVYRAALEIAPQRVALLAAGVTAFNPMFLFISASVNNDNLVTLLASLIVWQSLAMLRRGFDGRRSLLIAVLFAAASLSKLSGLLTAPLVAAVGLVLVCRASRIDRVALTRALGGLVLLGGAMIVVWLVTASWWYARNLALYGELFGTGTMVAVAGARREPFSLLTLMHEFEGFRIAYWGLFGAVNVLTWPPFYLVMDALTALASAGLVWHLARKQTPAHEKMALGLLLGLLALGFVSVIAWTAQTYASQGRLLFPVMAAASTLLAVGWNRLSRWSVALVPALAAFALVVPFASIAPRYTPPAPIDALPAGARPVYAFWRDVALVGYHIPQQRYRVGDFVPVTLYWRVQQPSAVDYSLFLHLVTPDGRVVGKIDTYPGGGTLQTSRWQPGIYPDEYTLQLDEAPDASVPLRVQVGWYRFPQQERLTPIAPDGSVIEAVMLDAGAFHDGTAAALDGMTPASAVFGGIRLLGYRQEGRDIALLWEAAGPVDGDYTVFVQALDARGQIALQGDAPPAFPTRFWLPGERYVTRHTLAGEAAGTFSVVIGWYRLPDFQRLPTDAPDGAFPLLTLTVP